MFSSLEEVSIRWPAVAAAVEVVAVVVSVVPRASMMRQRARYSSSVGGVSERGRLVRFFFIQGSCMLLVVGLLWFCVRVRVL